MGVCSTRLLNSGTIINIFAGPSSSRCTALYVKQSNGSPIIVKSAYLFDSSNVKHDLYIGGSQTAYLGSTYNNGLIANFYTGNAHYLYDYRPIARDGVNYTLEEIWGDTIFSYISSPTNIQQYSTTTTTVTHMFTANIGTLAVSSLPIYAFDNDGNLIGGLDNNDHAKFKCDLPIQKSDVVDFYVAVDNDIFQNYCNSSWKMEIWIKHKTGSGENDWQNWYYIPTSSVPDVPNGGQTLFHFSYGKWFIKEIKVTLSAGSTINTTGYSRPAFIKCEFIDPVLGTSIPYQSSAPSIYLPSGYYNETVDYVISFASSSDWPNGGYDKFTVSTSDHPITIKLSSLGSSKMSITFNLYMDIQSSNIQQIAVYYRANGSFTTLFNITSNLYNYLDDTGWGSTTTTITNIDIPWQPEYIYFGLKSASNEYISFVMWGDSGNVNGYTEYEGGQQNEAHTGSSTAKGYIYSQYGRPLEFNHTQTIDFLFYVSDTEYMHN